MPTDSFTFTGAEQTWTVPANVTRVLGTLNGAEGGDAAPPSGSTTTTAVGANGGEGVGYFPATPGETLYIYVGGQGDDGSAGGAGGFNGGGDGARNVGGGGGGASDVRRGGNTLADRVAVAGGGGGGGSAGADSLSVDAGAGGAGGSQDGVSASTNNTSAPGGTGGGQAGAAGGAGNGSQQAVVDGSFAEAAGGGGGAGLNGGGGGAADTFAPETAGDGEASGAGGGGGSVGFPTGTQQSVTVGANAGDGSITLVYIETPQNPAVTAHDATSITLDWDAVTNADEYTVYKATATGSGFADYTELATTATVGYTDTGLLNGEKYFYRVTATDTTEGVESGLSTEVSQVTDLPAPTNLTHPSETATTADYSWVSNANNGTIRVEYKDADTATWQTFSTVSNTTEAETVTGLSMGTDFDSRVVAQTEHTETIDS